MQNYQNTHETDRRSGASSIRVIADGADGYRLYSATDELVGWVRGRVVGVDGFATRAGAIQAALKSYRAVASWVERQGLRPLPPLGKGLPRLVHDGEHRWIQCGEHPVARLPEAIPNARNDPTRHSYEIVLRGMVSEGLAIHAALVAVSAVHGRIDAADITWPRRRTRPVESIAASPTTHVHLEDV